MAKVGRLVIVGKVLGIGISDTAYNGLISANIERYFLKKWVDILNPELVGYIRLKIKLTKLSHVLCNKVKADFAW